MYIPVKVNALSKPQISRLLNQHGVKLKIGGALEIHVSKEQHKKLNRAHKRSGAAVITFDPFQIQNHQHLRGKMHGKGTRIEDQGFSSNDIANFLGAHQSSDPIADKQITLNQAKDAGMRARRFLGLGIKKRGRPRKMEGGDIFKDLGRKMKKGFVDLGHKMNREIHDKVLYPAASALIHEGIPMVASALGGMAGTAMSGGPIGGMAGAVAGEQIGELIANQVGKKTGLGLKKRGRPSKMGIGMGQKKVQPKKRVGRPRKGYALRPAGY